MNVKGRIIFIITLALLVQAVFILFFDMPIVKDAKRFERMAYNISEGRGLTEDGKKPSGLYPGAPVVFSAAYAIFDRNPLAVKVFQGMLFAIFCVIIYFIG